MAKAIWHGVVLAESAQTEIVEGNHYFPPNSINRNYFKASSHQTTCHWKGIANYYTIEVNGKINENAAWYYPAPNDAAGKIKDHVAFWRGVQIES